MDNVQAYLLGAVTLALPNWVAVGTTVAAVLLLTGRERLHQVAHRVEMKEIITLGQFLILTGLVLPLLPSEPVTTLTSITPRQAWFAMLVVCTLSYASYLAQHYWAPAAGGLWMAALGGFYSSTATTVVLARQAGRDELLRQHAQAAGAQKPIYLCRPFSAGQTRIILRRCRRATVTRSRELRAGVPVVR